MCLKGNERPGVFINGSGERIYVNPRITKIVTHAGVFHIDEVAAIALLMVFGVVSRDIKIVRTRDKDIILDSICHGDFLIDVGGEYNGVNLFDHHQDRTLTKSSAGLIWQYLNVQNKYPKISQLVDTIDKQDIGIEQAPEFSLVAEFKRLNGNAIDNDNSFKFALDYMFKVLSSLKREVESLDEALEIVKKSEIENNVLYLDRFHRGWSSFVNGQTVMSYIKAVVWYDAIQKKYLVQIPPLKEGSFDLNGERLTPCETMEFVHANGFMAVADTLEIMKAYLKDRV